MSGNVYRALQKGVVREAFDKTSDKTGELAAGEEITATETRMNDDGQLRIQFDGGWVSLTAGSGKALLEEVSNAGGGDGSGSASDDHSDDDELMESESESGSESESSSAEDNPLAGSDDDDDSGEGGDSGAGKTYRALVKGVIREDFDKTSNKLGDLGAGEVITALETRFNDDGQLRVQFEQGWVSMTSGSGKELLEEVSAEEVDAAATVDDATDAAEPEPDAEVAAEHSETGRSVEPSEDGNGAADSAEQLAGEYKAVGKVAVREAAELDSEQSGALVIGEVIEVLESKTLESGQVRVRFDRGWTSLTSKAGKQLLVKVEDEEENEKKGEEEEEEEEEAAAIGVGDG